jgi:hypothetical protein
MHARVSTRRADPHGSGRGPTARCGSLAPSEGWGGAAPPLSVGVKPPVTVTFLSKFAIMPRRGGFGKEDVDEMAFNAAGVLIILTDMVLDMVTLSTFSALQASPSLAWAIQSGMVWLMVAQGRPTTTCSRLRPRCLLRRSNLQRRLGALGGQAIAAHHTYAACSPSI